MYALKDVNISDFLLTVTASADSDVLLIVYNHAKVVP